MKRFFFLILFIQVFTMTISSQTAGHRIRIAFSKAGPEEKYKLYIDYFRLIEPGWDYVDMFGKTPDQAVKELESCSGLVVTGGPDVYPGLFGEENEAGRCGTIDRQRDELELALIGRALEKKMPVFAICRGLQILNVSQGGSLVIDIPADVPKAVQHRSEDPGGAWHPVDVDRNSRLYQISGQASGKVNSFHHQSVDKLADCFVVTARATDGVVEALEWNDPVGKSFLIAVQWHPERMLENEAFSRRLAAAFLKEVAGTE